MESDYIQGIAAYWPGHLAQARGHFEAAMQRFQPTRRRAHVLRYGQDPELLVRLPAVERCGVDDDPRRAHAAASRDERRRSGRALARRRRRPPPQAPGRLQLLSEAFDQDLIGAFIRSREETTNPQRACGPRARRSRFITRTQNGVA